jgi:hypothetical protein
VNSGVDQGSATQGGSNPQAVNLTAYEGLVCHPSAVGTVKLMDLATEMEYDIRRQGTLWLRNTLWVMAFFVRKVPVGIKDA